MNRLALAAAALLLVLPVRAEDDPRTLTYVLAADIDTLDPAWAYDTASLFVVSSVYETLVAYEGASVDRFEPRIASVVPTLANGFISKDGLSYAFPLRSGVRFHDGSLMTPEDVRYSLLRFLLTDREGGPSSLLLEPLIGRSTVRGPGGKPDPAVFAELDKAVALEGGALVLRLKKPFAPLISVLAGFAPVVSRAFTAAHGGWDGSKAAWTAHWNPAKEKAALYDRACGTGPFKLEAWDLAGKRLLLSRNDAYWRKPASLAIVRLQTVGRARDRRNIVLKAEADVVQVERRDLAEFKGLAGITIDAETPVMEVQNVIFFNLAAAAAENPWLGSGKLDGEGVPADFFADSELRKAFALSFDADAYIREAYDGHAERAHGPIPKGLPGYAARQAPWPYSLEQAAAAFKRARNGEVWAKGFLLPFAYNEGQGERRIACRLLKDAVAKVNPKFRVECRPIAQSKLLDEFRARRLPLFAYRWVLDYPDAHNAVHPFLHSKGYFAGRLGYSNAQADALIESAAVETDPSKRKALYAELQALAIFDAPQIYTVDAANALVRREKVRNWVANPIFPYGSLYEVNKTR